ncbi:MAG: DUF4258 domain-containing protein [Candidatus Zambryskibacteria bacterium]|nr:DUF4258 domain-containing protein [Candidatus Zambryskibacteria bacterium]
MKLKFQIHFQQRIVERSIDVDHIKWAINNPDQTAQSFDDRVVVIKKIDFRKIKVVYIRPKEKDNTYVIITAYYL